jgi:hypothetical protein
VNTIVIATIIPGKGLIGVSSIAGVSEADLE